MTLHFNKNSERNHRKYLRLNFTDAERLLWEKLRQRKILGFKFRRQYSVDYFVIDFYCPKLKFGVEVDGKIHLKKKVSNHDGNRDSYLNHFEISLLRIINERVFENINDVVHQIESEIDQRITVLSILKNEKLHF